MPSGNGDEVLVKFNGDSQKLQGSIRDAIKALQEFGKAVEETDRKVGGRSPGGGGGSNSLKDYKFNLDSLTESALKSMGAFGGFMMGLNSTIGVVTEITSVIGGAVSGFLQFAETVGGVVVSALRQAGEEVANLTQQVFALNEQTEKNFFNWGYLYGGPNGGGVQAAGELARWSKQASLFMPFTRQDLMSAITTLSAEDNANPQQIEHQLQLISDVAATQGRPGLTLQWAAMAALRASQPGGSARMLMMDLNLNRNELAKYGYDENDPTSFWPALEAYEKHKGSYGASRDISQQTMWGALTSAQDRLQNMGLAVGGWNDNPKTLTDDVLKGSMFDVLKKDLVGLTQWWDDHSKQINQIADFFKNILGGAFKTASDFLQGLATGLQQSGVVDFFELVLQNLGGLLNSKDLQTGANNLGGMVGKGLGALLTDIGIGLSNLFNGLSGSGAGGSVLQGLKNVVDWLSDPGTRAAIANTAYVIGQATVAIKLVGDAINWVGTHLDQSSWEAIKLILIAIGTVFAAGLLAAFGTFLGILLLIAAPVLAAYYAIKLFIDGVKSLADALKGIHWPTFRNAQPGDPGSPEVPGGSGPTTFAPLPGMNYSSATVLHFYGASAAQVAYHTNRLLDERDRGSYLAKRTPGGFSSLGILG